MRKTRTLGATAAGCLLRKVNTSRPLLAGSGTVGFKTKARGVTVMFSVTGTDRFFRRLCCFVKFYY